MRKATFADGTVFYFDENAHAQPTGYDGHALVSVQPAADDEEVRFESPATPLPAADLSPAG